MGYKYELYVLAYIYIYNLTKMDSRSITWNDITSTLRHAVEHIEARKNCFSQLYKDELHTGS
jgi:hypothetical protein